MRLVFGLVLIVGVGLAGFAVYMAQGYINQAESALVREREARAASVEVVDIYVAAKRLRYGQVLRPEDVKLIKFPKESLPPGAFTTEDALFPNKNERPRMVLRVVEENEPMLASKVTEPGREAGVAAVLAEGMRAFTIQVDVTSGVSGFLSPGDRVDIFWTGRIGDRSATKLILGGVYIIAIDQSADQDRLNEPSVARTVTVQITPTEVASLQQAQSSGDLTLALVGTADTTVLGEIEVDQRTLLGIQEVVREEAPAPRVCYRTERRGNDVERIQVSCAE